MAKNKYSWYDNLKENSSGLYSVLLAIKRGLDYSLFKLLPDAAFLKIQYRLLTGRKLDLKNPKSFNEKLQYMKLYRRNPELYKLVDKYEAKMIVANKLGENYVFPTLGIWDSFDEIDFDKLPDQFVLKTTHDSGGVVICRDKKNFDKSSARKLLNFHQKHNYYWHAREWAYKNVIPRIIAEPFMEDDSKDGLKDYKVFCFDGEPKVIQVDFDRFTDHKRNLYTPNWEYIPAQIKYKTVPEIQIPKPEVLDELLRCAGVLSQGFAHVRADFYVIGNQVYFGELTFCHGGGCEEFTPAEFGDKMGSWIDFNNEPGLLKKDELC